jgi:hypothetical protein
MVSSSLLVPAEQRRTDLLKRELRKQSDDGQDQMLMQRQAASTALARAPRTGVLARI